MTVFRTTTCVGACVGGGCKENDLRALVIAGTGLAAAATAEAIIDKQF